MRFGILTVSTTCSQDPTKDQAGPKLENAIGKTFPDSQTTFKQIVTDDLHEITYVLNRVASSSICDILITVGGTGFAPSDVTPEATKAVIEKEAPGLAYALISKSLAMTDLAMLSRAVCGIKNKTIIVNFPGSSKAAVECFGFIKASLPHAVALVRNDNVKVTEVHEEIQQSGTSMFGESKIEIIVGASRIRKSPYPMLEVKDALALVLKTVSIIEEAEEISIENAATRTLAEDVKAPNPVPAFPASIKDGYAVKASDGIGLKKVRSVAAAGDAPQYDGLQPGEIIRISTGAPLPAGADAIVQVEDTELVEVSEDNEEEKIVNILVSPKIGQDIRQVGSDIEAHSVVLNKHTAITPAYIGLLAMLGIPKVKVTKRPALGIISTGNELVHPKHHLKPGLIYDCNKVTLITVLSSYGYKARDCGIARDTPTSVKVTLENAFENNDFVISSGGVSMSEYDLLKQVLIEDFAATIHFGRLNMKPGKPTVFASLDFKGTKKIVFALPGNPVSCCVTSLLFVIPTLKYMENDKIFKGWPIVNVTLLHDIVNNDSRPEYVRIRVHRDSKNELIANSTGNQISSRLNSMVDANGLLLVPGKGKFGKGECISVYLFGQLF